MKLQLSSLYKWAIVLLMIVPTKLFAAGPPKPSDLSNPFAQILLVVIIVLAVCIAILANVLLSAAQFKMKKKVEDDLAASTSGTTLKTIVSILFVGIVSAASAQDTASLLVANNSDLISGISSNGFYGLMSVVLLELIILLALIYNLKFILRKEKALVSVAAAEEVVPQENKLAKWWDNINKFRPVQEEAAIDLGHDYDGIRELDNRLPPWWLYGFYLCVIFAGIYLWRYHIAQTAPLSKEELAIEMKKGEEEKAAYLKNAANNIDETTVQYLTAEADLTAGKQIFITACAACHLADGGGSIGPNLTDDYWIHGGSIQDIFKTIKYGVVEKGMKSWKDDYGPVKMAQIASYIKSLKGTKPATPKAPQGELYAENAAAATDSTAVKVDSTKMK
jgi:cytochrome c oxidase cbb3-type subunit 3